MFIAVAANLFRLARLQSGASDMIGNRAGVRSLVVSSYTWQNLTYLACQKEGMEKFVALAS